MKVYAYQSTLDLVFYMREGKVVYIAEIETVDAVEDGITKVCGDELVVIEAPSSIEDNINLETFTDEATEEMGNRLNQWITNNNL